MSGGTKRGSTKKRTDHAREGGLRWGTLQRLLLGSGSVLGSGMVFGLLLRRFFHMMRCLDMMSLSQVSVVPCLFVLTSAVGVRCRRMLFCRLRMMFCGFAMMLCCGMICH